MAGLGIVFIHGICGNCSIFDFLEPEVPQGAVVRMVTLPGHGGNALDFSQASMRRWRESARQAVDELAASCSRVIGVGHSMGCLLLMELAARGRLEKLFLLCPPMKVRLRQPLFANIAKVAAGRVGQDPTAIASAKAYGIAVDLNPLHYYGWAARFLELFSAIRHAKRQTMAQLQCPVWAFVSARDEMVSPDSARCFASHPTARLAILPSSTHLYFAPADRRAVADQFRQFAT